jgi:hypothetical protein
MTTDEKDFKIQRIRAFIEVLGATQEVASFYLESSDWNIETAVCLWLEYNPFPSARPSIFTSFEAPAVEVSRYRARPVNIEGLPADWIAEVHKHGQIFFTNIKTGAMQFQVPPGFADNFEVENNYADMMPPSLLSQVTSNSSSRYRASDAENHLSAAALALNANYNSNHPTALTNSSELHRSGIIYSQSDSELSTAAVHPGEEDDSPPTIINNHVAALSSEDFVNQIIHGNHASRIDGRAAEKGSSETGMAASDETFGFFADFSENDDNDIAR